MNYYSWKIIIIAPPKFLGFAFTSSIKISKEVPYQRTHLNWFHAFSSLLRRTTKFISIENSKLLLICLLLMNHLRIWISLIVGLFLSSLKVWLSFLQLSSKAYLQKKVVSLDSLRSSLYSYSKLMNLCSYLSNSI